jgi:DNA-binding phage protein
MKSMPKGFRRYDTLDHLKTEADIAAYLEACNEMDDAALIADASDLVGRARSQSIFGLATV